MSLFMPLFISLFISLSDLYIYLIVVSFLLNTLRPNNIHCYSYGKYIYYIICYKHQIPDQRSFLLIFLFPTLSGFPIRLFNQVFQLSRHPLLGYYLSLTSTHKKHFCEFKQEPRKRKKKKEYKIIIFFPIIYKL